MNPENEDGLAAVTKEEKKTEDQNTRCGFVALLGLPNAGKSTLLNALVDHPVSIMSPKPQTTRFPVRGVVQFGASQVILVDTPGLLEKPKTVLDRSMLRSATGSLSDVDRVLLVVDVTKPDPFAKIQNRLQGQVQPNLWVALNKIDRIAKPKLLEWAAWYADRAERIFMISALRQNGTNDILKALAADVPPGPWLFDADTLTTLPVAVWLAEMTREALLFILQQEIPHQLYIETEKFEKAAKGGIIVRQVVHVARQGHKKIVLGKAGANLKKVGMQAKRLMQERFGKKRLHLYLYVRVTESWMDRPDFYRMVGLDKA